jgi:hypothetical protein
MYAVKEIIIGKMHQARKKKIMQTNLVGGCMYKTHERGCICRNQFCKSSQRKKRVRGAGTNEKQPERF